MSDDSQQAFADNAKVDGKENGNQVLLIDLENCPNQIHQLMENLGQYSQVLVCYAQCGVKISIDWILPLTATVNENKLKLVKMPQVGKNAADFGIAFWAGVLMAQSPVQTHFDIVSNDADLDHVVSLLIGQQRSAKRIGVKKNHPEATAKVDELVPISQQRSYLHEYCLHINNHSKPAKRETLLNSIKSKFKADNFDPEIVVKELIKHGIIAINDNKVTYNPKKITEFAVSV